MLSRALCRRHAAVRCAVLVSMPLFGSLPAQALMPGTNWEDSYSVGDQCYCYSTFDHDIGGYVIDTPAGPRTVLQVCAAIGPGPGVAGQPIYNDIQCGNGPANTAADETLCPGRVDMGEAGCSVTGPTWNLDRYFPAPAPPGSSDGTTVGSVGSTSGADPTTASTADALPPPGLLIEAEDHVHADAGWSLIDASVSVDPDIDIDAPHLQGAGQTAYMELLPDLRHAASPLDAEGMWASGGVGPQLHYAFSSDSPGLYAVSLKLFTTDAYDELIDIGVDDTWPATASGVDSCAVYGEWTWTDCDGTTLTTISVASAGAHLLQLAAREDGVEIDQLVLRRVGDLASVDTAGAGTDSSTATDTGTVAGNETTNEPPALGQAVVVGKGVAPGIGTVGAGLPLVLALSLFSRRRRPTDLARPSGTGRKSV